MEILYVSFGTVFGITVCFLIALAVLKTIGFQRGVTPMTKTGYIVLYSALTFWLCCGAVAGGYWGHVALRNFDAQQAKWKSTLTKEDITVLEYEKIPYHNVILIKTASHSERLVTDGDALPKVGARYTVWRDGSYIYIMECIR